MIDKQQQSTAHTRPRPSQLYEVGPLRLAATPLKTVKAFVNRANLCHNAAVLKKYCIGRTKLCAMVKANGYGHDAGNIVSALDRKCVDSFAVSTIEEAEQIAPFVAGRTILVTCPLFDQIEPQLIKLAQARAFHCSVSSLQALGYIKDHLKKELPPLQVHIKIDTGMGRLGCLPDQTELLIRATSQSEKISLAGIFTHLATAADNDLQYSRGQLSDFDTILEKTGLKNDTSIIKHACNTSATLRLPQGHYDMVRCGIGLYGYTDAEELAEQIGLRPILRVIAPLVLVKPISTGQSCGYGRTFVAPHNMIIGIIPMGYADGLLRCLSNRASMRIGDKYAPVIGRISMDLTIIDLTDIPNAKEGTLVTVIDDQPQSKCGAEALAALADTIPYEILTAIGTRIKRELV